MERALAAFRKYQKNPNFQIEYESRKKAAESIRQLLDIPRFNFDRRAFNAFYRISLLGTLRQRYRDDIFKDSKRLKQSLRYLVNETVPIEKRITSLLEPSGRHHIRGFGRGGVSKILAVNYPTKWPVLNGPVVETLTSFGYKSKRGLTIGERYRNLSKFMATLRTRSKATDVIALDTRWKRPTN
jgi:hypothetical protein